MAIYAISFNFTVALLLIINAAGATHSLKSLKRNIEIDHIDSSTQILLASRVKIRMTTTYAKTGKGKCKLCPEPELNLDLDRQEAAFAMAGALWSTGVLPSVLGHTLFNDMKGNHNDGN